MGRMKEARNSQVQRATRTKFLRGERVTHKRGDTERAVMYIAQLDKGFCKIVNNEGKIESVPEFEIRGYDDNRANGQQGNNQKGSGDFGSEPGEPSRKRKSYRHAS